MSYVFAPSVDGEKAEVLTFKRIVEYIGSKQTGIGGNYAKGKRYLKSRLNCSGTAIKRLYKTAFKVENNKFKTNGTYVFKYNNDCDIILSELINWLENLNPNSDDYKNLHVADANGDYFKWLFSQQYLLLGWVVTNDYCHQRNRAQEIYDKLPPH